MLAPFLLFQCSSSAAHLLQIVFLCAAKTDSFMLPFQASFLPSFSNTVLGVILHIEEVQILPQVSIYLGAETDQ